MKNVYKASNIRKKNHELKKIGPHQSLPEVEGVMTIDRFNIYRWMAVINKLIHFEIYFLGVLMKMLHFYCFIKRTLVSRG